MYAHSVLKSNQIINKAFYIRTYDNKSTDNTCAITGVIVIWTRVLWVIPVISYVSYYRAWEMRYIKIWPTIYKYRYVLCLRKLMRTNFFISCGRHTHFSCSFSILRFRRVKIKPTNECYSEYSSQNYI